MSPFSAPVLGAAALLASSALWQAFVDQTLAVEVALTRYLIAVVAVWVALSALVMAVGEPASRQKPEGDSTEESPAKAGASAGASATSSAGASAGVAEDPTAA